ncbi:MAG: glycosyl hydrolase [Thermoguttaceae bacterium]
MKRSTILALTIVAMSAMTVVAATIEESFRTPPDATKPGCYWYWINDNVSKDGVVRDLEAMHEVGIGRAFIGNIGEQDGDYGKVKLLSDEWWDITHEAVKTATKLGIEIGMFNSPGWSQSGGPWVKPEQSMRYLATSEARVAGGKKVNVKIPAPGKDFQDVRTIAFRTPKDDAVSIRDMKPTITTLPKMEACEKIADGNAATVLTVTPTKERTWSIDFTTEKPFTARSVVLNATAPSSGVLEVSVPNESGDGFRVVSKTRFDRSNPSISVGFVPYAPVVVSIPATTAKSFRLGISENHGGTFSEIDILSAPRVESFAEKTLAKMWPTPLPLFGAYLWRSQPEIDDAATIIPRDGVIDISKYMKPDGTLEWDAPDGDWIVQRTGMLTTGVQNSPATKEAKGLEIDKMSRKHAAFHFDAYMGKVLEKIPAADRESFKVVVQDSYETGGQNWTDGFIEEFQQRYGYDPTPFLPVMQGRVVASADMSDRFLWDLRRLIADKVAHDYVGGLREVSNKHGLKTWLECYGHWGFPGEFLQYGGQSDYVAGEFWNEGDLGSIENRAASSCGHIYGKKKITAESFTAAARVYERHPRLLKKRCDWSYTEGINETLLHLYIHQPYEDKTPGVNAWFATEFNRKNTWFYQMRPFVDYMRRCMFMLQQGQNVADVAYFIGEDAPKMTGAIDPPIPSGYSFDYINGEVIRDSLSARDGKFVLPHGTSYRLLVLPNVGTMRPEVLRKIAKLVEDGGCILGTPPAHSPSLENYPKCDEEVAKIVAELWGKDFAPSDKPFTRKVGKGIVCAGMDVKSALAITKTPPDCITDNPNTLYVHRELEDGTEIYFVCNQVDETIVFDATFRVSGKQPELWDAVTGEVRSLPAFTQNGDTTTVPLKLYSWGSAFIVFRKDGKPTASGITASGLAANFPAFATLQTIATPWTVTFDKASRGPESPQTFEKLIDWSTSSDAAIRNYSGTATYKNSFTVDAIPAKGLWLDLGAVEVIATVRVNGKEAATLWTAPWRVDVTPLVKTGENTIEIDVVNTWTNRLIGDASLPVSERPTWITVNTFKPDQKLSPSGLLGPVTLESEK